MPSELLNVELDLYGYFKGQLTEVAGARSSPVSEPVVCYLAQVLAEAGREEPTPGPGDTLAELHVQASLAPPAQAVTLLKRLGDWCLLLTGYFREQLDRRRLSPDYCARLGEGAYDRLGGMFRDAHLSPVFGELSSRFETCAAVIADVRDANANDTDAVRLYEEWLRTGSPRIARRLMALGLIPARA